MAGAMLLAVCQGRISEGIDFSDDEGRAVVVAGIPFPPAKDPRVLCKKQVLDDRRRSGKGTITGVLARMLKLVAARKRAHRGHVTTAVGDTDARCLCSEGRRPADLHGSARATQSFVGEASSAAPR